MSSPTPSDLDNCVCGFAWADQSRCPRCGRERLAGTVGPSSRPTEPLDATLPAPSDLGPPDARPTLGDYELRGELGRGGMGVVYRAFDRRRGAEVALKTLPTDRRVSLARFKREFRSLAGISHPNLAALYDLAAEGERWFFTMELVEGVDFLAHVRGPGGPTEALRPALRQLAEGVRALHTAGRLHRDLKPSNVRVTPTGRVVLLDFGLVAELDEAGQHHSTDPHLLGTAAYMAPEQAACKPVSPASDWYSVGVILYEALTGFLPFRGTVLEVLTAKQDDDPPPPGWRTSVPPDLEALCLDLMSRDPARRPTGEEVLRRLGASTEPPAPPTRAAPFVGRAEALAALSAAYQDMARGRPVTVFVAGRSGMGKSTLLQHFLDSLADNRATVLAGRCYEHEAVPFKALDGAIDALGQHLRRLPAVAVAALLPRDVGPLVRVFPVLGEVPAVAAAPRRTAEAPDPQELRRRAFAGLRELLARLGDRGPLVLAVDDLQWGDLDSAALLAELLRPPDPPALLLVGCFRIEDEVAGPCLEALAAATWPDRRDVALGPLSEDEARALARELLDADPEASVRAAAVARESGGSPFFVQELARHAGAVALTDVIGERVRLLSEAGRRLLEVIAVAGRPLPLATALHAAGLASADRATATALRSARLLRSAGPADQDEVVPYHDQVRTAVLAGLDEDGWRDCHRRLVTALTAAGGADPEALALHHEGAGHEARASACYAMAAARAAEALAFDRAAALYRRALALRPADSDAAQRLRVALGDALANAGRGAEAAEAYLEAASPAGELEQIELKRRAALSYLASGHLDEGLREVRTVLHALGLNLPGSPLRAAAVMLWNRFRTRLRGHQFQPRPEADVPARDRLRIDACWSMVLGFSLIDPLRGAAFQAQHLWYALRAGEPSRIVRALAIEAAHRATAGESAGRRSMRLLESAEALARDLTDPYPRAIILLARGALAYLSGRWAEALSACDEAEQFFRDHCRGAAWERNIIHAFSLWSLVALGHLGDLARRRSRLVQEAYDRGDRYAATMMDTYFLVFELLGRDEPRLARERLTQAAAAWPYASFDVQHHNVLLGQVCIDLYEGNYRAAWDTLVQNWPRYRRSLLLQVEQIRIDLLQLRGKSAVALAIGSAQPKKFLADAEWAASRLERERAAWSKAFAALLRAQLAAVRGETMVAVSWLEPAAAQFDELAMHLYAAAARRRLGELLGGERGRGLIAAAEAWMGSQDVRHPARLTAMLAPGFPQMG